MEKSNLTGTWKLSSSNSLPRSVPNVSLKSKAEISSNIKKTILFYSFLIFSYINTAQVQNPELINEKTELKTTHSNYDSLFSFKSQGDDIFYRKWRESNNPETPKVLLIIHGTGYHSYPFIKIMNYVDPDSVLVYAMALRGHGLSGKTKGVLESNENILTDMDNMIGIIKQKNPNSKIYILGTSMGGLYTLGYLLSNKINSKLSGAILDCPALIVQKSQIIRIDNLKLLWLMIFNHSKPGIRVDGKKLEMSSINKEWIISRRNDRLAMQYVNIEYLQTIQKNCNVGLKQNQIFRQYSHLY